MHALMAAILLGVAGLDALDLDAEPEPPDREPAQSEESIGTCEWHAVIGANGTRQAELLECALEYGERIILLGCGQGFAGDEIAAGEVADGQRIAITPVGEHELALVVGARSEEHTSELQSLRHLVC